MDITVVDPENDYQPMTVSATSAGDSVNVIAEEFSIVAAQTDATQVAHRIMAEAWIGAHTIRFGLGPSHLELDPGDAVVIGADPIRRTYRIQSIDVTERRSIEGLAYDPLIYGGIYVPPTDPTSRPQPPTEVFGPSQVWFADLPMLSDTMARPWAPRVFAWQNPFPPSVIVHASDDAGGWVANTTIRNAAAVGLSKYAFAGTPAPLWDRANSLEVETVPNVSLASTTDLAVLNGAHRAAIRHPTTGAWEVFAYRDAVLTDTNTYRLSRFLRGLNGTEDAIVSGAGVPAGATVVFLDASGDQPLRVDRDRIGEALEFRYGPNQAPPNDFRVRQETVRIAARGLKPFSPAHVRAQIGTDVRLTWIRRTRYNGDSWLPESVPLNEAREQYEVRVFAAGGTTAVRTERLATPNFTYTAQAMSSDFGGSRPSAFDIDVSQVSEEVGSGTPTKLRVSL